MPEFSDDKKQYLVMIQGLVARMEANSFALKSWTVTLVAAILALSATSINKRYALISVMPVIIFWVMDTYYIQLQRKYRFLFESIRKSKDDSDVNFDLSLETLNQCVGDNMKLRFVAGFLSKTELMFYLPVTTLVVIVVILIFK